MINVVSIAQYKELVAAAKAKKLNLSNCYFLFNDIKAKISKGGLFCVSTEDSLFLLEDKGTFYRCYYYLSDEAVTENAALALDKEAVIEFPFSGAIGDREKKHIQKIQELGFRLGRESSQMQLSKDKLVLQPKSTFIGLCGVAADMDTDRVLELINTCLNPLFAFLPDKEALSEAIAAGHVFVIRNRDLVVGALVSSINRKIAMIDQLVVDPCFRGKGYGTVLVNEYHSHYMDKVSEFRHWVDINNVSAVTMYQKFGYDFTLRKANEYILTV